MKILTILGARPQFIKAATVSRAITKYQTSGNKEIEEIIIHTGQHYDANLSDIFFEEMDIPKPKYRLGFGNLKHGAMTGGMLERCEELILNEKPSLVLVYGDTNSTLAGALAASKMHIPVAHVEAGLRSYNMAMPEEINRVLTDRLSNYLFCPTDTSVQNLKKEGLPHTAPDKSVQKIFNVGDVMYDATVYYEEKAKDHISLKKWNLDEGDFALCTIHRAENTDDPTRLKSICQALHHISKNLPIIFPIHPRTKKIIEKSSFSNLLTNLNIVDPLSYLETQRLEMGSKVIFTDSGGIQKEAFFHKVPCVTFREETEWIETTQLGWNHLVGSSTDKIINAYDSLQKPNYHSNIYGDGQSAFKIINEIVNQ